MKREEEEVDNVVSWLTISLSISRSESLAFDIREAGFFGNPVAYFPASAWNIKHLLCLPHERQWASKMKKV